MKKKCLIRFASIIVLCCVMLFLNGCNKVEQRDIYVPSIDSITGIKVGNEQVILKAINLYLKAKYQIS